MLSLLGYLRDWFERPLLLRAAETPPPNTGSTIWEDPDNLGYQLRKGLVEDSCPDYVPLDIMAL